MRGNAFPIVIAITLGGLAIMGGSVMVWQAGVASPELAPAQEQLIALADWTGESGQKQDLQDYRIFRMSPPTLQPTQSG